jgi:hypothetical protein
MNTTDTDSSENSRLDSMVEIDCGSSTSESTPSTSLCSSCDLTHGDVLDLLCLTFLIYDYGKKIDYVPEDTLQKFIARSSVLESFSNDETQDKLSPKMKALVHVKNNISDGIVKDFISDDDTDLQVGITISEKNQRINIIFRGSESTYDWLHDLNIFKSCIDQKQNVYVHAGFLSQLITNNNHFKLINKVKSLLDKHPSYNVYSCGHSLGGALSTLFGYLLSLEIPNQVTVVSFASPRVGNFGWKEAFEKKANLTHYRVTNRKDIVTAFPSILYYHVGEAIKIGMGESANFLGALSSSWWEYSIFYCYSPTDHFCSEYYKNLCECKWNP